MWNYEKRLQHPVNIKNPNPKLAQVIITQFGGPDGELSASMRYLSQRYAMPYRDVAGVLTDIGSEASKGRQSAGGRARWTPAQGASRAMKLTPHRPACARVSAIGLPR